MDQELLPIRSRGQSVKARIPLLYLLKIQDELCKNAGCTDLIFFRKLTSRFQKWNMFSGDIDAICKELKHLKSREQVIQRRQTRIHLL